MKWYLFYDVTNMLGNNVDFFCTVVRVFSSRNSALKWMTLYAPFKTPIISVLNNK
jgi:hypothetical protein